MKLAQSLLLLAAVASCAVPTDAKGPRKLKKSKNDKATKKEKKAKKGSPSPIVLDSEPVLLSCPKTIPKSEGKDNSERLLLREGVIDEIPSSLCGSEKPQKNVILVVGDGMGWEMVCGFFDSFYFIYLFCLIHFILLEH